MNYTREDYRLLYNEQDELDWHDITPKQRLIALVLFAAILCTGFVDHETVSVMEQKESKTSLCPRYDVKGRELLASMVLETYTDAPKPHECIYGEGK